ncbi:hypothetical protein MCOR02_007129 [Pyricularia oryzae]|uniref:NAD(P)-binding domain-containing protein n=1 Tax=Pyricularia grisea TaxID=148305 RepID=A0ABQ8N2M8_PYRGI|nr:hypothetical protein MCOR01_003275 [Pyricularia oryzae]KAI6290206.1 hypothetical protein MCOR33_011428 [Pyricularia grisea]KAH9432431.1 hypothetical protein MCOR02_007129 [Pyricularia oryzae]KAI6252329.1 hypothetical protein MCOR19_011069 [Pyricularia oryzae]KAI6287112.1 hypothetical protein MCOR26_000662 [Pyricularia oryzae]
MITQILSQSGIGAELARRLHRKGYLVAKTARRILESEHFVFPDTVCIDVNLKAAICDTVLVVHFMRQNRPAKEGRIVVVTSMLAQQVGVMLPEYAASKAGAQQWAQSTAPVLQVRENITDNVVSPGAYNTDIKAGFLGAFRPEHLCIKRGMMAAFDEFLDEDKGDRTGMVAELTHDSLHFHDLPPTKAGELSRRSPRPYEPWFQVIHGEQSGLSRGISSSHLEGGDGGNVKIIAVTGATGAQGGGVVNIMKNTHRWRVSAITRNPRATRPGNMQLMAPESLEVTLRTSTP